MTIVNTPKHFTSEIDSPKNKTLMMSISIGYVATTEFTRPASAFSSENKSAIPPIIAATVDNVDQSTPLVFHCDSIFDDFTYKNSIGAIAEYT